jgi:hypothetical protein
MTKNTNIDKINPVAAGIVGAVIGAVGTAAAMTLSDPENRKKVSERFGEMTSKGSKALEDLKKRSTKMSKEMNTMMDERMNDMKSSKKSSKKSAAPKSSDSNGAVAHQVSGSKKQDTKSSAKK